MGDKAIKTNWEKEDIILSVYRENDTPAERAIGTVNGHEVQVVHENGSSSVTVKVDDHIQNVPIEKAADHIRERTG